MTRAAAMAWPDDREYCLEVRDHAVGSPTVCAAVSGLVYALAGYLANDDAVTLLEQRLEPGDARLRWRGDADSLTALRTCVIGLLQIEKAEPDHLSVTISKKVFD